MLRIAQNGLLALQIVHFLLSMPVVYRPHPLYWYVLMRLRMLKLSVGKGRQVIQQLCSRVLQYSGYRALVLTQLGLPQLHLFACCRFTIWSQKGSM